MSKFIVRVGLPGFRDYEVEASSAEEAEQVYMDNLLDDDKVKLVREGFDDTDSCILDVEQKGHCLHY